jgi:hypothetical protein
MVDVFTLRDPNAVPVEVSNFQGRTMLRKAGLFDAVQDSINAIADPLEKAIAQDAFERGTFSRNSALLASITAELNLTSEQVDEMFRQAVEITA